MVNRLLAIIGRHYDYCVWLVNVTEKPIYLSKLEGPGDHQVGDAGWGFVKGFAQFEQPIARLEGDLGDENPGRIAKGRGDGGEIRFHLEIPISAEVIAQA